jgi:hypothetical protein
VAAFGFAKGIFRMHALFAIAVTALLAFSHAAAPAGHIVFTTGCSCM